MIPTKTLRERMTERIGPMLSEGPLIRRQNDEFIASVVQAAIDAIGDPVLIKTADSLEPTFTLRAQDKLADDLVFRWAAGAAAHEHNSVSKPVTSRAKIDEALACSKAMRAWPTRKWPD